MIRTRVARCRQAAHVLGTLVWDMAAHGVLGKRFQEAFSAQTVRSVGIQSLVKPRNVNVESTNARVNMGNKLRTIDARHRMLTFAIHAMTGTRWKDTRADRTSVSVRTELQLQAKNAQQTRPTFAAPAMLVIFCQMGKHLASRKCRAPTKNRVSWTLVSRSHLVQISGRSHVLSSLPMC